ncbi:hypothetical protein ACPPVO_24690 [Dactylosporangium sp. McL0621]|uniref:aromatic-ring hydroxylase C-terminal domain-containing protein n=1 Tax=Dactylosporangium sp. McL0621 TaxID=3415678 RepID=UPI003CE8BA6B
MGGGDRVGAGADAELASYVQERHPVGRLVLRSSGAIIHLAMVESRAGRLARSIVGGAVLRLPPIARKAAGTISGIGIDYPHAPRAADLGLQNGRRLYETLRDGRFVLVAPPAAGSAIAGRPVTLVSAADAATPWTLVRPDAHVAWRGRPSGLEAALAAAGLSLRYQRSSPRSS